jgi:hypothetical protein
VFRLLRAEELCQGGEQDGATACPLVTAVRCVGCGNSWEPPDIDLPGRCGSCGQSSATLERCDSCPVLEIAHYRATTAAGQLLERVLEHEFDCKHYKVDPGEVDVELREGLKMLEQERGKFDRQAHERRQQEWEDRQRVQGMQQRQTRGGF